MKKVDIQPGQLYQYRNGGLNLFKEVQDKDILFIVQVDKKNSIIYNPRRDETMQVSNSWMANGIFNERFFLIGE